jgi:DNA-binding CsgD family transcriptional regulator
MPGWHRSAPALKGRNGEQASLNRLVRAVRSGDSRTVVIHGEPGVGKTALLDYVAADALDCQVSRVSGVQSEMELPFSALHQICNPLVSHSASLPTPQRDALAVVFGLSGGPSPDRFLVGLATLGLLSVAAAERPLICLVDDHQWLDCASAQILAFVARRLGAEALGLVFATREPAGSLAGLPEMKIGGLRDADARALLDMALGGPIDDRIRDQIIAETHGNPLALLELPRELPMDELAGGFGLPGALPAIGSIEQNFQRRIEALPPDTRRLLVVAAADPSGDPALVWRAALQLGIGTDAAPPAAEAGLADFGPRLLFRHPLARSAAYQSATARERQDAHRALAEVTKPERDPDRRAWHLAQATSGTSEEVAAELERSAGRASSRGGLSAAAAFLERSALLTLDPSLRAKRALAAADAKLQAGAFEAAQQLLETAEAGQLGDVLRAHAELARARLAFVTSRGAEAAPLLVKAASRLSQNEPRLSRATYLDALSAATFAGRLGRGDGGIRQVARAAAAAPPPPGKPEVADVLLDGLVAQTNEGMAAGGPLLRKALSAFGDGMTTDEELHWLWLASVTGAVRIWDDALWDRLSARHLQLARDAGALTELPLALTSRAYFHLFVGELATVAVLVDELNTVMEATGIALAPYGPLGLSAFQGNDERTRTLVAATLQDVKRRGEGVGVTFAHWANAVLNNGLGRYDSALEAARKACAFEDDLGSLIWATPELVEAGVRSGADETARRAFAVLVELTEGCGTDWALGILARSRALVTEGPSAEDLYREGIDRLGRTQLRVDLARAHLLYGEWLRRGGRRGDARAPLRMAYDMFNSMDMNGFAERTRHELRTTGDPPRRRTLAAPHQELTPHELLIARMARDGLSNPEIGTRLFISTHTVQYHLRKIFTKLGVRSRSQLERVLPRETGAR